MFVTNHPAWPAYKAALTRLVEAGSRLEEAQASDSAEMCEADQEFQAALTEYTALRVRLTESGPGSYDEVPAPQAWLGPPMNRALSSAKSGSA